MNMGLILSKSKSMLLLALCMAALMTFTTGCAAVTQIFGKDRGPDYNAMAEAIALSRNEYQAQKDAGRMRVLKAMDGITWYTDGGELKLLEIDQRMGGVELGDPSAPGSAFTAFCAVAGLNAETYLPPIQDDPTLGEALKLRINDLTGRMHSVGIPGARVIINALYDEGYLVGDASSAANFAPKITLQARAIVEEVSKEDETGTLSGKIDYQAEGGYFEVLCKALGIADDRLYPKLTALATGQDAERGAQKARDEETQAQLPGTYTGESGQLELHKDGTFMMVYGMSFSAGSWSVADGKLVLGDTAAAVGADGIRVDGIDTVFVKQQGDPGDSGDTDAQEPNDEEKEVYEILYRYHYSAYRDMDVTQWYGSTTDEERVEMAAELLEIFTSLGHDVFAYTPDAFASAINGGYDHGDRLLTVWQAACGVLGMDGSGYDKLYERVADWNNRANQEKGID